MTRISPIARNISANYLGTIVAAGVLLILTPFMVHHLGATAYGIWVLIHSIIFYLHFLDLGLYNALVKYIAEYATQNRKEDINNLVGTTLNTFIVAGFIALGGSILIALFLVHIFKAPPEFTNTIQVVLILFGVELFISFPGAVFDGILEGHQRYDILNYVGISFHILGAITTIVLVSLGYGLISLVLLEIVSSLVGILVDILIIKRFYPYISFSLGLFDREIWKIVWRYSFWSLMNEFVTKGSAEIDKLLIPVFLSISLVTPYSIACSLAALIFWVVEPIVDVFFPLSSELDARAEKESLRNLLMHGTKLVLAITLPISIIIFFMGKSIITNWVGSEYAEASHYVLQIIVLSFLTAAVFSTPITILTGLAKLKEMFFFTVIEIVLAVIMASLTIKEYQLVGLAASCAVANIIMSFGCLLPFTCKSLRISVARYIREAIGKPLISAVPTIMVAVLFVQYFYPATWMALILEAGIILFIYVAGFSILSISNTERKEIYFHVKQMLA